MELVDFLDRFDKQNILVLGDIIADEFIIGQPERLSREAPVLILEHTGQKILPGGGTNAANNVSSLGGQVYLAGIIGDDRVGKQLIGELKEEGMITEGVVVDPLRPTSVKTRILAGGGQTVKQQVVRIDNLETSNVSSQIEDELITYVEEVIDEIDAILLSDYGNGVFTDRLKNEVIKLGKETDKIIAVDSRYQLSDFKGVTIATPNKEEAEKAVGFKLDSPDAIKKAGWKLKEELRADAMLLTLGGEGMQIFFDEGTTHIPASNYTDVFDVTGAGDTVFGALALALVSGASMVEAMKIANYAAGIVVRKTGVATLTREELKKVIEDEE